MRNQNRGRGLERYEVGALPQESVRAGREKGDFKGLVNYLETASAGVESQGRSWNVAEPGMGRESGVGLFSRQGGQRADQGLLVRYRAEPSDQPTWGGWNQRDQQWAEPQAKGPGSRE